MLHKSQLKNVTRDEVVTIKNTLLIPAGNCTFIQPVSPLYGKYIELSYHSLLWIFFFILIIKQLFHKDRDIDAYPSTHHAFGLAYKISTKSTASANNKLNECIVK